jgi:hypothetical protein
MVEEGDLLWTPSAERQEKSHLTAFARWLKRERGLSFDTYEALWQTLTGKKLEVPVRRVLMGVPADQAANRAALANPSALDYFIAYAKNQTDY